MSLCRRPPTPAQRTKRKEHVMKTIGLLGGMSWESSRIYYRIINEEVAR